ncbi:unnamed protein product [Taenia asiatica]|uniref:Uncharacterized protein n=1 Tax=Taenia asiatica TaxID=60517 RepID=A0A0R3W6T4_TAEAS|nr:unnamed protein product [Taenia asiatica]
MGSLKSKSVRKLPPSPPPWIESAHPRQKRDEVVSRAVEVDFSEMKVLVDKCVQIHPEVMEEKTSMESFQPSVVALETRPTNEPPRGDHSLPGMFTAMDDLDLLASAHLTGGLDEELLMDILMDELTFTGSEENACVDVEQCLRQLLVDLEEKSLEKTINRGMTFLTVAKRPLQPKQSTICAKRRRIGMEESYGI